MDTRIDSVEHAGWKCYELSNDLIRLRVAPQIGGRIVSLTYEGDELLFLQSEHAGESFDWSGVADADGLAAEKERLGFRLWGGDKTWVSPQHAWRGGIPPLELDAGAYQVGLEDDAVFLLSPLCRETGLRIARTIRLQGTVLRLTEELRNPGDLPVERGVWNVTQILRPALVYVPVPRADLRAYPEEGDSQKLFEDRTEDAGVGAWTRIICREPGHFKFGGRAGHGELFTVQDCASGPVCMQRLFATDPSGQYAHDSSVEIYNSPDMNYCEVEVHAPLRAVPAGGMVSQEQTWRLSRARGDEDLRGLQMLFVR